MAAATTTRRPQDALLNPPDTGLQAWRNLLTAHSQLLATLDHELRQAHGLTIGDYDVLVHLADQPRTGLRMCELAEAVVLSPSGISRRVDRLERDGLVVRERDAGDARNVKARLTDRGKTLFRRVRKTHLADVREHFVDRFDERELEELRDMLGRLLGPGGDTCPTSATTVE